MESQNHLVETAMQNWVAKGEIPQVLCKFRSYPGFNNSTKDLINKQEMKFSPPTEFNDPFDTYPILETNPSIEQLQNAVTQMVSNATLEQIEKYVREYNPEDMNRFIRNSFTSFRLCCFSESKKSIIQWSHYADSHKGICLEFDILKDPNFFFSPHKITYTAEIPTYKFFDGDNEELIKVFTSKYLDWKYEKEFRILKTQETLGKNLPYSFKFHASALSRISFGAKCSPDHIKEIISICQENAELKHVTFEQAVLSKSKFGLDFISIS